MWLRGRELVEGFRCSASIKRTVLDAERSHSAVNPTAKSWPRDHLIHTATWVLFLQRVWLASTSWRQRRAVSVHSHTLALVGRLGRGKRLPRLPARKPVSLLLRQLGKVGRHAPRVFTRGQNHCRPPPRYWLRMGGIILRQSKKKRPGGRAAFQSDRTRTRNRITGHARTSKQSNRKRIAMR